MSRKQSKPPRTALTERLNFLLRTTPNPATGKPYTDRELADAINEAARPGEDVISHTYLWQLRTGAKTNPTRLHLAALAAFFEVSPAYFFDGETGQAAADVVAWHDDSVRETALRAAGLSPQALQAVAQMIDTLRTVEGLPVSSADPDSQSS